MTDIKSLPDCPEGATADQQLHPEIDQDIVDFEMRMIDFLDMLGLALEAEDQPVIKKGPNGNDCLFPDYDTCKKELMEILEEARNIVKKYD